MTTPIENERAEASRQRQIYEAREECAKPGAVAQPRSRVLRATEGAVLGVVFWLLLFTLGVPWVFHIGGFDGMLPSAIVGTVLGLTRWRWIPLASIIVLLFILVIATYTPIIASQSKSLVRNDSLPASADAIMVLSAGTNDDGTISPQAVDRLLTGLDLYNQAIAPVLMVSREAYLVGGQIVTSRADQERIISLSPDALSHVVVAGITHSTHDEAMRVRDVYRARGWKRIVLVTSPFHTRRACATFEKAGVVVSCRASVARDMAVGDLYAPDDRLKAFQVWLYETMGTIRYRQLGWI